MSQTAARFNRPLAALVVLHLATTFVHFLHNALYLSHYPGLPAGWTATGVLAAWTLIALLAAIGTVLMVRGRTRAGSWFLVACGALGFGGLLHYAAAPFGAHDAMMHLTILMEAASGTALIVQALCVARQALD